MGPLLRSLLLAALLQLAPAQGPVSQPDALSHQKKVVSWIDVYARATCQPREVVVPLTVELMGTVAKQLVPSCVTVQRCGGCCPDDGLECVPTGQHQVRMQILMIRYPSSQLGEMSLEEHSQCECRPKKRESALKPDSPRPLCPRCTQRRQRPDPRTCRCRCQRRSFLRCQGRGLELNPDTCSEAPKWRYVGQASWRSPGAGSCEGDTLLFRLSRATSLTSHPHRGGTGGNMLRIA